MMNTQRPAPESGEGPLAIVCGGGTLPFTVAESVNARGRAVVLFALRGFADAAAVSRYRHHWMRLGQAGRLWRLAQAEGCRELVMIGSVVRPRLLHLRPDWLALRHLPDIVRWYRGGDDHLLTGVAGLAESLGFRLLGAHEVAPEILAAEGLLGRHAPSERDRADIARGLALLAATGSFDIGQAAVVADGRVLAIEAAEGTDAMLERIATLRKEGRIGFANNVGVLVKAPKQGQDRRLDLPAIGPRTIENVARAGLAGMAMAAGATIIAKPQDVAAAADRAGLFVIGLRADTNPS
jgi:DUF1009 family protein